MTYRAMTKLTGTLCVLALAGCPGPEGGTDAGPIGTDAPTGTDAPSAVDAGGETDTGPGVDGGGGTDAGGGTDGGPGTDAGPTTGCGGARPSLAGITGTEGMIIGRDGTIYYSQGGAVGRMTPGGTADDAWSDLPGGGTVWGLALDAANTTLFVGSPGNNAIYRIDTATGVATMHVAASMGPNGLTMGPDGALYYSRFNASSVWRVATAPGSVATQVTLTPISNANGVAFDDDGTLLVCSYSAGTLTRLTLTAGIETGRAPVASGLGSPDGVAVDANGDYWVTNNAAGDLLYVRSSDGMVTNVTMTTPSINAAASLDFGAGALDCEDIYVASGGTLFRYEMGTVAGAAVPWH
jgi:sugar lactone lactonase YvrE